MARPGIEPRTSDLRVRCLTDCATRPGFLKCKAYVVNKHSNHITVVLKFFQYNPETSRQFSCLTAAKEDPPPRPVPLPLPPLPSLAGQPDFPSNQGASSSFRRHVPTRSLINQCQKITFLILKSGGGRVVRWCWVNFQCRGVLLI